MSAPTTIPAPPLSEDSVPGQRQNWFFWAAFILAWVAGGVAQGAAGVVIPAILQQWDPAAATQNLSVVLTFGGLAIMVTTPLFGRFSDRSMSRLGLRRPWIAGGALLAVLGYFVLAFASNIAMLALGTILTYIGWGAASMVGHTLFADQVRKKVRASMSAIVGAATVAGILLGTALSGSLVAQGQLIAFLLPGGIAAVLSVLMFFALKDIRRTERPEPFSWQTFFSSFWLSPRAYPDFAWAWICRFFMTASITVVTSYLYLTISGRFGILSPPDIAGVQAQAIAIFTFANIAASIIFGILSDRLGRRKFCVVFGALLSAIGLLLSISTPDLWVFFLGLGIVGAGQGAYIAADVALMTEVLPSTKDAGKDLGIVALAYLLPGILVPVLGFILTRIASPSGQNFVALYIAAFVMALIAAWSITKVKSVR